MRKELSSELINKLEDNCFKDTFDQAAIGIIHFDREGKVFKANQAISNLIGYLSDEIIGKHLNDFVHPDDANLDLKSYQRMINGEIESYSSERRFIAKGGGTLWLQGIYNRVEKKCNTNEYFVGFFDDITLKIEMEKEKELMAKKLFQTSKLASLGQLAAGVGHEINNPLAIINGYIELLEAKILKDEFGKQEILNVLKKQKLSVNRIATVVSGLRSYSCDDDVDIATIDIHEVIDNVLDILQVPFEKDSIHIIKEFTKDDLCVQGNFNKFQQVFTNILNNAKDATSGKEKRIIVIKTMREDNEGYVRIVDNGHGMEKEVQERIYDTFFTTKEVGKGSGLGMGIVKNIVEACGGSIEIMSQPDLGATIDLKLPIIDIERERFVDDLFPQIEGNVLVVEDEDEIRKLLGLMLLRFGLSVDYAENGKIGLELARKNEYKYIFTDIKMPEMDGNEMMKQIQKIPNFNSKIFVLTGVVDQIGDFATSMSDGCLMKPFNHKKLYNLIAKNIGKKED